MADENTKSIQDTAAEAEQPAEGEKKFTQADVDRIVKKRLHEDRTRKEPEQADEPAAAAALDTRETELQREARLDCREYLADRGYPAGLLDILDTSDKKAFSKNADALADLFQKHFQDRAAAQRRPAPPLADLEPRSSSARMIGSEALRHKPKGKYYMEGD